MGSQSFHGLLLNCRYRFGGIFKVWRSPLVCGLSHYFLSAERLQSPSVSELNPRIVAVVAPHCANGGANRKMYQLHCKGQV